LIKHGLSRKYGFTEELDSIEDLLEKADATFLGECKTQLTVFISFYLIIINLTIFSLGKEGIHLP